MMQDVKGFRVEYETTIDAPREKVFDAMLDITEWFPHRFIEGSPIVQEYGLLGRGYEDWGNGDGALFSITTFIKRPSVWVVLNAPGVFGHYLSLATHKFEEIEGSTRLSVSMFAMGDVGDEDEKMYQGGYGPIFDALRTYVLARG